MKLIILAFYSLLFFGMIGFSLAAKNDVDVTSLVEAKAHYTIQIIENITWPNESTMDRFVVGVFEVKGNLFTVLKHYQHQQLRRIRGKPLVIIQIDNKTPPRSYSAIIAPNKKLSFIKHQYKGLLRHTLLISDGAVNQNKLMISLVAHQDIHNKFRQIRIELNRDNLMGQGFNVSPSLLNFAGTKDDLKNKLQENQQHIEMLHTLIESKELKLKALNNVLQENKKALDKTKFLLQNQKDKLAKIELTIQQLQHAKNVANAQVSVSHHNLLNERKKAAVQLVEFKHQKIKLMELVESINQNELLLNKQIAAIQKQKNIIQKKQKTISIQRLLLYILIVFVLLTGIFINYGIKLNRQRKKNLDELKALNDQLYELATTDNMTQLYNRRHFLESAQLQLTQLQRTHGEGAVLMIDIDYFKKVNDTYGHAMGDEAIICISRVLRKNLREYDIVGRLGGEEFAMLLSSCPAEKAIEIVERVRTMIAELSIVLKENTIYLTISIGLTTIKKADTQIEKIIQRADKALYQAKASGRNKHIVL